MNEVIQAVYDKWLCTANTKTSPAGWITRNAVCCSHRGESQDRRMRGGMKLSGDGVVISCFNCGFKASYQEGRAIYPKFENLLKWMGFSNDEILQLKMIARKVQDINPELSHYTRRVAKPIPIPDSYQIDSTHKNHIEYLNSRGLSLDSYTYFGSTNYKLKNRIIVPFNNYGTTIGYTARSIVNSDPRFIMNLSTDYVFGMDFIKPEHNWIIVCEGIFDAISVSGLAVLHNVISDTQAEFIHDTGKQVIVVPDYDTAGLSMKNSNSLIRTAIDFGWDVSLPDWKYKDINECVVDNGLLYTVKMILASRNNYDLKIKVKQKMILQQLKMEGVI